MTTADQVEGYVGTSGKTSKAAKRAKAAKATRIVSEWTGRHRMDVRAMLTMRRMFYVSRHRRH
jgi:hypothetical protein